MATNPADDVIGVKQLTQRRAVSAADVMSAIHVPTARADRTKRLLLYVHVPFCNAKCLFCDWVVDQTVHELRSGRANEVRVRYVDAVCTQIRFFGPQLMALGYKPELIVWGGGTPSILDPAQISAVCTALRKSFDLSGITSHTFEMSPETVTMDRLEAMRAGGVDRITMGAESFNEDELRHMGRPHSVQDIVHAVDLMRSAGFQDINLDLMTAMPEQTMEMVESSVRALIDAAPSHATLFTYRPTRRTVLAEQMRKGYRRASTLAFALDAHRMATELLEKAGYVNYMVTAFQKRERAHIPRGAAFYYATGRGDYIGFGCGGLSALGGHRLQTCTNALDRYVADPRGFDSIERFSMEEWDSIFAIVYMMLGTDHGVNRQHVRDFFGLDFDEFRRDPRTVRMLEYYQSCGARIQEEPDGRTVVTPDTRAKAYITAGINSAYRDASLWSES